ncbi:MAG TPA: peptidoglycan editing factor PgeF [Clostridia bacterium]|nr:peptidoglycan editing factor PgeF [Clostridia bacterium]
MAMPSVKPAGPYAIKKQRAKRDAEQARPEPKAATKLNILKAAKLERLKWLMHGFSTRQGGVTEEYGGTALNLGITREDTHANVASNRQRFMRALGAVEKNGTPWPLVNMKQVHSAIIHRVTGREMHSVTGDGLITDIPGILLSVKTADCLPIVIVDPVRRAIGVFHAGWRGTVQRIVEKGVGEMRKHFGSDPADMLAAIGPGIGSCCYEVGDEVQTEFETQFAYATELFEQVFDSNSLHIKYPLLFMNQRAPGHGAPAMKTHLNLAKANLYQLRDAGVPEKNVEMLGLCTACRTDIFFSHRIEYATGRMMAAVGIRS